MLFKSLTLLSVLAVLVSATSWESIEANNDNNPSGRFARDLSDLNQRLKFAFAFAKRSADKLEKPSFAFAKRSSSSEQDNARFARAAFAKFAEMNNLI